MGFTSMHISWSDYRNGTYVLATATGPSGFRVRLAAPVRGFDDIDHLRHVVSEALDLVFSFGLVGLPESEAENDDAVRSVAARVARTETEAACLA